MNLALAKALNMKRRLKEDAVPTIDVAGIVLTVEGQPDEGRLVYTIENLHAKATHPCEG